MERAWGGDKETKGSSEEKGASERNRGKQVGLSHGGRLILVRGSRLLDDAVDGRGVMTFLYIRL